MNERVSDKEYRQSQMHGQRTNYISGRPRERQSYHEVYDPKITNEVWIEWTCVWDVCREVRVPRTGEENHPGSINEAENARYYIEEP
jgi:hypothetical protein